MKIKATRLNLPLFVVVHAYIRYHWVNNHPEGCLLEGLFVDSGCGMYIFRAELTEVPAPVPVPVPETSVKHGSVSYTYVPREIIFFHN